MNTGAFGEGFPYSNFHDLNLDWVIKIAKDFLDQYTHIQETIETGLTQLDDKTADCITALNDEKTRLEELLEQWYNTHSEDIANELATALSRISSELTTAITAFNTEALNTTQQCIESIPADYTELALLVSNLQEKIDYFIRFYCVIYNKNLIEPAFIKAGKWINTNYEVVTEPNSKLLLLPVTGGNPISLCLGNNVYMAKTNIGGIIYYDSEMNVIEEVDIGSHRSSETYNGYGVANFNLPSNIAYFAITIKLSTTWDATNTAIIKYGSGFAGYTGTGSTLSSLEGFRIADIELRNSLAVESFETVPITTTIKKLLQASGAIIDYDNSEYVISNPINVKDTSVVKVTGSNTFSNGVCAFYDDDDYPISVPLIANAGGTRTYFENVELTVPLLASYLIIQGASHTPPACQKKTLRLNISSESNLNSKKVCVIGDSITEENYTASSNWVRDMINKTGCIVQNLGISGTGFFRNSPYINRIASIDSDCNIIGVGISFNDIGYGVPIGEPTDTGTTSLCGYVNDFFDALLTAFPATPIICYSTGPWASFYLGGPLQSGTDYINKIKTICNKKGIPVYDKLYMNGSVLRPWNAQNQAKYYKNESTQLLDNTHPNSEGHKIIANYLIPKFEQNIDTI